jgi:hypothetical protein
LDDRTHDESIVDADVAIASAQQTNDNIHQRIVPPVEAGQFAIFPWCPWLDMEVSRLWWIEAVIRRLIATARVRWRPAPRNVRPVGARWQDLGAA